jgi:hypothetical protein
MSLLFSWSWMYVLWLTLGCIPWHSDITRAGQFLFIEIPNHIVWIMTNMTTIWTLSWRSCSNFYPLFCRSESKGVWRGHLQLLARAIIISCSGSRLAYDVHWVLKDFLLMGIHNLNGSDVESSMPVDRWLLCWQATQSLVPSTSWGDFLISLNLNQGMFLD